MRTKRFVGRMVMIAVLVVATAGVMPAGACNHCKWQNATVPNIHTYGEQSSNGNLLDQIRAWFLSLFA